MSIVQKYFWGLRKCLDEFSSDEIEEIANILFTAYQNKKQIFVFGNGGSASTASHFVCDLQKTTAIKDKPRVRASSLNDNIALITAIANDIKFECIFKEQLVNNVSPGDVVVGISASGNSPDILTAMDYARKNGAITIGFVGFGGGKLKEIVDAQLTLSSTNYGQVEDMHLVLSHIISYLIREKIANGQ
jgi:D-sedoheptulose 7-phosphate isomerase